MSIEDDLVEQDRWERQPSWYKRNHPAPCPELVSEKTELEMMTLQDWLAKVEVLEKQLAEKDAMIDWLAAILQAIDNRPGKPTSKENWIKAAQEAVRKC